MAKMNVPTGVGDWDPKVPTKGTNDYMQLLTPDAKDNPDALNGTNQLKNFVGGTGSKATSGDLGSRGRNF